MKALRIALDERLYSIIIIGGILGIVAVILATLFIDPQGRTQLPLFAAMGCVTIWVLVILAFWWYQLLFAGYAEVGRQGEEGGKGSPEIRTLKSWGTLSQAMAVQSTDPDQTAKLASAARNPVILWYGLVPSLAVILSLAYFWLRFFGIISSGSESGGFNLALAVLLFIVYALIVTYFLLRRSLAAGESAHLKPLGLSIVETASLELGTSGGQFRPVAGGTTIIGGERHGRAVQIEASGRWTYTIVLAGAPEFTVTSQDGKLIAGDGAPEAVVKSLKPLRKAKRWVGIDLAAGPAGIGIERQSRGQNMWLYDLWLAERLLEALQE